MRLLKKTEEYATESEMEAKEVIEKFRKEATDEGYLLGACGFTHKEKKAKGEIIDETWIVKAIKIYGPIWL